MILVLAFFTYTACKQEWITLESGGEESLFGYDFSQGYTSLERDEPPPRRPRRKKTNFLQRWLQRRAADKLRKQQENAEAEARRCRRAARKNSSATAKTPSPKRRTAFSNGTRTG